MIGAPLPYVAAPVEDRAAAAEVAVAAAERWGLKIDLAAPLSAGMSIVYAGPSAVVRVARTTAPAAASHALAAALHDAEVPAPQALDGCAEDIDGFAATAWQRIRETRRPIDWEATGEAIRRVHDLPPAQLPAEYPLSRPQDFPWWSIDEMLAQVAGEIDASALDGLQTTIDASAQALAVLDTEQVVCHGDVHHNNVMMSGGGPVLIDWDLMCWSNPMWDHAFLLDYTRRWGGPAHAYDAFAAGYGRSYRGDADAEMVAELRNVVATLLRLRAGTHDPNAAAEAQQRLRYWRGDPSAPTWVAGS